MKILITNVWLNERGGTEIYVRWLAIALAGLGHEVTCFTPNVGVVSEEIERAGIRVVSDVATLRGDRFDLIHAHHRTPSLMVREAFPNTPMLFLAHGTEPEEEQPPTRELGDVRYFAVSEGVKHNLHERHGIVDVEIIRNPVDLEHFRSHRAINAVPQHAILLKNAVDPEDFEVLQTFFAKRGISFDLVGGPNSRPDVVTAINEADLVVTWGRGALEALACERQVIAYGHDHLVDGMITSDNFYGVRTRSFNGRVVHHPLRRRTLKRELEKYNPSNTAMLRRMVSHDHASDQVLRILTKRYAELVDSTR
jgi:hypothetical protein